MRRVFWVDLCADEVCIFLGSRCTIHLERVETIYTIAVFIKQDFCVAQSIIEGKGRRNTGLVWFFPGRV